jgi:circadian clock protein KaiC
MEGIPIVKTGIRNLDGILGGGIPLYSVNIVAGASGSGKTILTQQLLFSNCGKRSDKQSDDDSKGIFFTTLSEPAFKMIRYQQRFSYFDVAKLNESVFYVDIGQIIRQEGLDEAIEAISCEVERHSPQFIVIDSFKAIHDLAGSRTEVRRFSYDLAVRLSAWTCTSFLVGEYTTEEIATEPVFAIADGILTLHNKEQGMQDIRTLRVVKLRGMDYFMGHHPFTISSDGITVYPRITTPALPPAYEVARERLSTGVAGLDEMLRGGFPQGSITLIAGGAGLGKTLLSLHFAVNGIERGEPCVFVSFQETPSHLRALAEGFGWDLADLEAQGLLQLLYTSPVELIVDQHTAYIKQAIVDLGARRVVIDGLKDIEIATPDKVRFKDYTYSLANFFRAQGVTSLLTNEIPELFGTMTLSEHGISFIADNVILLRYVELASQITRAISILKMRGSDHDKSLREYRITSAGLEVLEPFEGVQGIITGTPTERRLHGELERLEELAARMDG